MASKAERSRQPADELFGGRFRRDLAAGIYALWSDELTNKSTLTSREKNESILSCTIRRVSAPDQGNRSRTTQSLLILGSFDSYATLPQTLECSTYLIEETNGDITIGYLKGNEEPFTNPNAIVRINSIFFRGSRLPIQPSDEYYEHLIRKMNSYPS